MSDTFTQIYIHAVFAVKGRENLLHQPLRDNLFKYMAGIINEKGHKSIIVNGSTDHVHILIGLNPSKSLSDLIRDIKNNSSKYINKLNIIRGYFSWQNGYGAFSYSRSQIASVYNYIENQEKHHLSKSFRDEYLEILSKMNVEINEKYLFSWIE